MPSECIEVENLLSGMLSPHADELSAISRIGSSQDRVTRYANLLRRVLPGGPLRPVDGVLSRYDGRAYVPVGAKVFQSALLNVLMDMGVGLGDVRRIGSAPLDAVERAAVHPDLRKVAFSNGVLDLDTAMMSDFDPETVAVVSMPYPYDPKAECPMWTAFLERALPDADVRSVLQEFLGMCLIDRTRMSVEKFAILKGGGGNGKSVIFDVVTGVLGQKWVSHYNPDQLCQDKVLAEIGFKFLNVGNDIPRGTSFDSQLKAVFSGQKVEAWKIFEGSRTVSCPPCAFALNELPLFRDVTDAFFRRMLVIDFRSSVKEREQDRTLASRIVERESSGVFSWLMEGRERLISTGGMFTRSEAVDRSCREVRNRVMSVQHPVRAWMERSRLSVLPEFEGQRPVQFTATEIVEMIGASVTRESVLKELSTTGVSSRRSDEHTFNFYKRK